jgi:shikimate kinase
MNQPIIITGFMGSGKTTLAQALARTLNCHAIDLDQLITASEGRTPKDIIEQDSESAFREVETRLLRHVLEEGLGRVIALGGGAWILGRNRDLIAQHDALTVWLDAPFELCWRRITVAGSDRPLAQSEEQARSLYEERRHVYQLAALHLRAGEGQSIDESSLAIAKALHTTES